MHKPSTTTRHHNTLPFPEPQPAPAGPTDPAEPPAAGTTRGRDHSYAPKVVDMICVPIRKYGFTDSAAAESVGMTPFAFTRWKHDFPEIKLQIQQARQEYRMHCIERIERFADRNDAIGFRAAIWLVERAFPGDYSKTQRERWACETAQEQRERNDERELGNVRWAEQQAAEAEARKAAQAEAAKPAAASVTDLQNVKNAEQTAAPGEPKEGACSTHPTFSSASDLQNVKNAGGAISPVSAANEQPHATLFSESDVHNVKNSPQPDARPLMEAIFGQPTTKPHIVKNPGEFPSPEAMKPSQESIRSLTTGS